jgi:DNA processing protein
MNNKPYFLALNRINLAGPRTAYKLLKHWPNLEDAFKASSNALQIAGIKPRIAEAISKFDMREIEQDLRCEACDPHHLLTWEDEIFPALLTEIYDPPLVLYAKGNIDCLNHPKVAMVGSRKPSITGTETAEQFTYELAIKEVMVVSGLALGIDAAAHRGCLQANKPTIAVMATGINRIYPARHRDMAEKILDKGLILTEFPLNTPPIPGHFPRRNRIISGLSLATLVVEAALKSGSLITARLALEQNREVLAIPGSIHNPVARGCHHLLQQGAKLASTSDDVLSEIGLLSTNPAPEKINKSLACDNDSLVKYIGFEVTSIDQIITRSGFAIEKVTCELAELELKGIVQALPGGYMRCSK